MSYGASISKMELDRFKARWPCHGLPDSLWSLWFGFDSSGDLVEIKAYRRNGRELDSGDFDGPALVALCQDAQRKVHPEHAALRYGKED